MPLGTSFVQVPFTVATHSHQGCEEQKATTPTTKQCNLNGHICCLGIAASQGQNSQLSIFEAKFLYSIIRTLALQDYPYKDYKPPKNSLQS